MVQCVVTIVSWNIKVFLFAWQGSVIIWRPCLTLYLENENDAYNGKKFHMNMKEK